MQQPQLSKIHVIEALRGGASISVALFHFCLQLSTGVPQAIASVGWLGVDVFFVISGFVIPYSIADRRYSIADFPRFLLRRLVRLEPPYLVSIALAIGVWHAATLVHGYKGSDPVYSLPQIASHLFYVIPLTHYAWLSPVYWTLAYEFIFYILVGLLLPYLIDRNVTWMVTMAALIAGARFAWRSEFDVHVLEFLLGILAMKFVCGDRGRNLAAGWIMATLAVVFALGETESGIACLIAVTAICLFARQYLGGWALSIGSITYSLYLTHTTIGARLVNLGRRFGDGPAYELGLVAAALAVSVAFAIVFSYFVERPAIEASRGIRLKRVTRSAVEPGSAPSSGPA